MRAWETMNALREFHAGSAVLEAAGLSSHELALVATIETEHQQARRGAAPAEGE